MPLWIRQDIYMNGIILVQAYMHIFSELWGPWSARMFMSLSRGQVTIQFQPFLPTKDAD